MTATFEAAREQIEAVWRIESARLIGGLLRVTRDLDRAEDLAQEALLAALETWPSTGIPDNPGAWLMTTAKHRAIDDYRRHALPESKQEEIREALGGDVAGLGEARLGNASDRTGAMRASGERRPTRAAGSTGGRVSGDGLIPTPKPPDMESALDDDVGDDLLRLILIACHPVLSPEARVSLTLRLLGGLETAEIARAFLVPESTIAQRIVRAKRTLTEARVPFEVPRGAELAARLPSVLEVVYLI